MRPPPPLALRCPASRAWRFACVITAAAAGAAMAAWLGGHAGWPPLAVWAAVLGAAVASGGLGRALAGSRADLEIAWDSERWRVDGVAGQLEPMLDLGTRLMLLRLRPDPGGMRGQVRWLAIEAPAQPPCSTAGGNAAWRALRTAIYSPPPAPTPTEPAVRAADRAAD